MKLVIFQKGSSTLGLWSPAAQTYRLFARAQDYKDAVNAARKAGVTVTTWSEIFGDGRPNRVNNLNALGKKI
jgi:hypothetical protein